MYRYSLYKTSVDSYYNKKYTSNFYVIELWKIFFQFEFGKLNYKKCDLKVLLPHSFICICIEYLSWVVHSGIKQTHIPSMGSSYQIMCFIRMEIHLTIS